MNFAFVPFIWPNVTVPSVVSPFASILKLPRIPFVTVRLNSFDATLPRVPFDLAIALRITCAACAAYAVYGSGSLLPLTFVKPATNFAPAPFSDLTGMPG
jgi:hypothetical protein